MSRIENIIVNDKTYKVQTMGVIDTFKLHLEVGKHLGKVLEIIIECMERKSFSLPKIVDAFNSIEKTEAVVEIQKKVLAQVITPKNTFLSDVLAIETWFSENPHDLWEVFINALIVLVGEFLPNFENGQPATATKTASESQTSIE